MASIEVKNFTNGADEVSTSSNARVETCLLYTSDAADE